MTQANLKKLNNSLKDFVNTVSYDELMKYDKDSGKFVVAGKELSVGDSNQIIQELSILSKGIFWNAMVDEVVFAQNIIMNETATTSDDLVFNRAVKHTLKVLTKSIQEWSTTVK